MICVRFTKRICLALALCALTAAFLACAADAPGATSAPTSASKLSPPTPTPVANVAPNITWRVPPSLEQQIYQSGVIVRASLISATGTTATVPSEDEGVAPTYLPVQELRFTVHEYLKGNGTGEILVVVNGDHTYLTEAEARREADYSVFG